MPEWERIVQENLNLGLGGGQTQEVIGEVASHLEDLHDHLRAHGLSEFDALRLTLEEVGDWKGLGRKIKNAKRGEAEMNKRTKTLWVPGLMAFAASSILLMILQRLAMVRPALLATLDHVARPRPTLWWSNQADVIYLCWWVLLPLCGAAGAYLSRRAGGTRLAGAAASLFPSIVMLCIFSFVIPISLVIDKNRYVMRHPLYFGLAMVYWIMVPGLALLLGALPFLQRVPGIQEP
jgi:hypothetical protein